MEKSIAKNAVFNMSYKALSVIFPLVIVSYASRKLGANGIGEVSSAQNLVTYFTMFAALGIPSYGVRAIAQSRKDREKCNKTFTELFIVNLCSTCVCTLLYFILLQFMHLQVGILNYIFAILIVFNIFNVEWVYEGFEKYQYIAIRSFAVKGISMILLFLFVKDASDIVAYTLIVCFGTVGNSFWNIVSLRKFVQLRVASLDVKKHLKVIFTFFGSVIAIELYSLIDITMLTYTTSSNIVGYYSNATKIVKMLANTITGIGAVMLPRLSLCFLERRFDDIKGIVKNFFNATLTLAFPATVGIALVSKEIVLLLFGGEFVSSIPTIMILSPLIVLMPLSGGVFGQLLLTSENEKKYLICVSVGAVFNCILNYFFISLWQHNGAALASVITEVLVNLIMIIFSFKIIKIEIDKKEIIKTIFATTIMLAVLMILNIFMIDCSEIYALISKIIVAVTVYFSVLCITKQKFMGRLIENILRKKNKKW